MLTPPIRLHMLVHVLLHSKSTRGLVGNAMIQADVLVRPGLLRISSWCAEPRGQAHKCINACLLPQSSDSCDRENNGNALLRFFPARPTTLSRIAICSCSASRFVSARGHASSDEIEPLTRLNIETTSLSLHANRNVRCYRPAQKSPKRYNYNGKH